MNKIFKVVWNRTIGSFVVTSELAKGRVKSSSEGAEGDVRASEEGRLKTLFRLTALSAALLGFSEGAWATIPEGSVTGGAVLAIGTGSTVANGTGAMSIGHNAQAKTNGALAIAPNSTHTTISNGNNSIAIGVNLRADGSKAIGIGADTNVTGISAIAIGNNDSGRMANQGVNGNGAIGVGSNLTVRGNNAIAVGTESQAKANDTVAVGTGAQATLANSIAIGKNSVATGMYGTAALGRATAIGFNTQALGEDSVAIGSGVDANAAALAQNRQSVALGWSAKATGTTQAVAIGPDAQASGAQSTSIGNNTRATGDSSIAIGGDDWDDAKKSVNTQYKKLTGSDMSSGYQGTTAATAAVAVGVKAQATGALSTAFGPGAIASGLGASAFGVGASATQDKSVAIGAGSTTTINAEKITTATVNGITYGGFAGTKNLTHGSQVSFGTAGYERQLKNVAPGAITETSTDAINGSQLYALHAGSGNIAKAVANALGGGAAVGIDPTNNQGTVTLPSYNVLKGSATPNMAGNGTANFNANPARSVADALTNLNTYVNQGFAVKDNSGTAKGIVTPGESVQFADGKATTVTVETEADGNTKVKYDVQVDGETVRIENGKLTAASQTHYYSVNRPGTPVANYNNDGATGENAIAAGPEARAAANNAVVIGSKATVEAAADSVLNVNGETTGEGSVAVGSLSKANGKNATAIGQQANAYGQNSFAGGQDTKASGKSSVAVGDGSRATDDSTTAVGPYAKAEQAGASAFGFNANAQAIGSVAVGRQAQALNLNAVSVGNESKAKGEDTVAIGTSADAVQNRAMAIGKGAFANDADTIAFGAGTKADKRYAIAIGSGNNAWKTDSIALGRAANADGEASLALGLNSHTRLQNAIALGNGANADHSNSIAIGKFSHAAESAGVAIGNDARALKFSSVVIGDQAQSNNSRSVVIGFNASATNPAKPASAETDYNQTVAIGAYANAWGDQSTAIGNNVFAKGNSSIAIGADDWDTVAAKTVDGMDGKTVKEVYQDYTGDEMQTGKNSYTLTTSGEAAVAIGTKSQATAELSTAFGTGTRAQGIASAAFGMGAKATKGNSVAIGAGSTTATDATKVNEATVNNLKYSGFAGGNNVTSGDQVSFGSKNYERQLKNVAPGEISNTSTDAINGSQLYAVQNVLGNTAKTVKNVLGSNAQLAEDGSITMNNIGGTGENTVDRAIASLKTSAFKSFQLETAAAAGTNGRAENHSLQEITSGSTLRLEAGKNIHLNQSGSTVSINTVDNPEFTGVVTAKGGLNMFGNRITNLGQGTDTNDAVNVGQLQDAMNNLRVNTLTTVSNDAPFSYIDKDGKLLTRNVKEVGGKKVVSFTYVDGGAEYTGDVTIAALNAKDPQTSVPTIVGNVKSGIKDNDAVNVSQLKKIAEALGTQVGTDGSVSMPTYAVVSGAPSNSSVVNYNTVGDALSALNRAVNSPLNFTGDVGNKFDRQLGSTVSVKGGQTDRAKLSDNNIGVVSDDQNHTLNVKLAKELTGLTSAAFSDGVTTGGTTVNGSGVTIGSGSNPVSLTAGGLSNGGNKVTNIADGAVDTDAASYKQVKAAKTEVQKGTNVAEVKKTEGADGQAIYTVNAKGTVVSALGADNGLTLGSSEDTTTNVTTYNLDLSDKTKDSLKKADSALQGIDVKVNNENVKTLTKDDSTLKFVNGTGTTAENKADGIAFNVNKSTLTTGTRGVVSADTAGDAFATATDVANAINKAVVDSEKNSIVAAGDNTHVASQVTGNETLYTVHADKTTVSVKADGGKLALNPTEATNSNQTKTTNYELDLSDDAKAEIQKGVDAKNIVDNKGITFSGNSGSPVTKKLDETLAIKGDNKNVETEAGTDGIKVKLKDEITLTSVTANTLKAGDSVLTNDGLNIANGTAGSPVSLTKSGLNNGGNKITKVAKGENEDDAVNYAQLKELADKGLTFEADGSTSTSSKKLGERVGIKGGSNITTSADSDNVTVKLNDDITVTSVTATTLKAGDSTLTTDGLKIGADGSSNQVSLTNAGLNNGGNKITKVAKGAADTDAVNVEQIKPLAEALNTTVSSDGTVGKPSFSVNHADGTAGTTVHTVQDALTEVGKELNKGLNIAADNGNADKVNLGETVTYTSKDKNIVTTSGTGKAIDFSLAEKVTIGKDAANGGKPVVIDGKEGIVSGLTNTTLGSAPLAGSNKAATEAQLDATQVNLATILGGNAANNKGNVTTNNIGETGANNVHDAIKSVKETADKGWNLKANDEADSEKIAAGDTVTVKQGKNIRVKRSGKDLTVETEDDVEFAHVKADSAEATSVVAESVIAGNSVLTTEGLKIGADGSPSQVSLTTAGLNNGGNKITNVAKGTEDNDAVNVAQLNEQLTATEKTTTVVAGKNVTVSEKADGNNTEYTVNADKTTLSQAANGAVKVSEGAKDADGVTDYALDLTDEAKADIAKGVAAKDAVDNKGLTFAADNGTTGAKKLGDSLSVKGDGNILTRADENGIGFSLADKITVGKAGNGNKPLVIDGTAGLISGLSNTTLGGADFATKGQAASEEQLNAAQANLANLLGGNAANNKGNVTTTDIGGTGKDNVHDAIAAVKETADKGWNLNANDETSSEKIGAGDTVTFKEGKNVKVSRNGKNITVATSDDVSFDKVTVGGSVLTDNGLTVGNGKAGKPVSLTKDGLNNGGNKVTDIAAGEADTDAVNVAQLKAAAAKATSKVDSGNDNIVVTPEQNADGSTTYKVATAPNLKADSFTAGDTVVNNDGVKVGDKVALGKDGLKAGDVNITADGINAGNKAISNVAAGVKDTDAANVGQLNRLTAAAKTEVEAGTNIASVSSKQGANGQTVYTVNADGASVSAGSDNIVVTKGNKDANNVTDYAVDLSKAVKADIAKGVAAKDAVDNKGISFAGDSGTTVANKLGDTVAVKGDANITTTAGANGIQVGLNKDLKVDSVKAGDTVVNNNGVNVGDKVALGKDGLKAGDVNITADGINAGGKKVTGVAAGTVAAGSTDAVNGGQLHQVYELIGSNGGNVNTAPPSVEADGKAGLGNIKNITLVDNSNNPNVTNVTNETKIAQSNGYSLVTYNVEDQGMYVTNNVIEAVGRMNEQGIKFFHTNDGEVNPDVQARNSEDSSASGAYATAVGFQAASKGTNAIAIGKGAKANAENTIAIGTGNIVSGKNSGAIGDPTVVSGNSSYSIGNNNNVSADNAYALGSNIKATVNDSVYLGDRAQTQGIHTADAAKGEAYTYGGLNDKAVAGKAGSAAAANKVAGVVTVGNGTDETRQVQGVAAGVVSADSTDAINGSQLYYTNQAIANVATQATAAKTEVTAGKNVVVNQTTGNNGQTVYNVATADKLDVTSVTAGGVTVNAQGVSIAAPTAHNPANTVSLSPIGLNNGGQRITNVAPAKEGTDAVNLNQLAGVGNALQNNIERVGKKAYAGVAGAIAQGSIPQVTRPGATGIGVGSGYYGGQSAMAIGVSAMSDGGNWVVKGNFSANTDGHVGVGAGALYQW